MADRHSFAILGGYGQLGRAVAALLLDRGGAKVTIAGRSHEKAEGAANDLAGRDRAGRVSPECIDADDEDDLAALLAKHDVLIHAAPLGAGASKVLGGALRRTAGRMVLVSHDAEAVAALTAQRKRLDEAGARAIVYAGADPGLPGMIGHLAAETHGATKGVEIAARYRAPEVGRAGLADILDGAVDAAWIFEDGWRRAGFLEVRRQTWDDGLGTSLAMPVYLPELDVVRERHDLRRLVLWHGGLNGLADMVVSLRRVLGRALPRRVGLAALAATMRLGNSPPYGLSISAIATGQGRRRKIALSHPDVYDATAQIAAWSAGNLAQERDEAPSVRFAFEQLCTANPKRVLAEQGFNLTLGWSGNSAGPANGHWRMRKAFSISRRLMSMDDTSWGRHANPWSVYSRMTLLPLFALAVWSRVWIDW